MYVYAEFSNIVNRETTKDFYDTHLFIYEGRAVTMKMNYLYSHYMGPLHIKVYACAALYLERPFYFSTVILENIYTHI